MGGRAEAAAAVSWTLDLRLEQGSAFVADLALCQVRLQDDRRWPWLVLVPRLPGRIELEDLAAAERARLAEEAVASGAAVRALGRTTGWPVKKLNLGALGNLVPQLHLHVVGRRADDPAWPGPVWGFGTSEPYSPVALAEAAAVVRAALTPTGGV